MSLHIEWSTAGRTGLNVEDGNGLLASETVASAGNSGETPASQAQVFVTLTATVDMWISIGASPAPGANPRRRLIAGTARTFSVKTGDRVGWA